MEEMEKLYINSVKKLKESLPKLILLLGMVYLTWNLSEAYLIPFLGDTTIGEIRIIKPISLIILGIVVALFVFSMNETRKFSESLAGILLFHLGERSDGMRYVRIKNSSLFLLLSLPVVILFLTMKDWLVEKWSFSSTIFPTLISIWVISSLFLFTLTLTSEIRVEEKEERKK